MLKGGTLSSSDNTSSSDSEALFEPWQASAYGTNVSDNPLCKRLRRAIRQLGGQRLAVRERQELHPLCLP